MDIRLVCSDIDGTLLPFEAKHLLASTVDALAWLRKNGVKTFIATGRPPVHLPYLHALDGTPFDGYVTMNGQYCYLADGELLYSKYIPAASLQTLLPYIEKEHLSVGFVGKDFCRFNLINDWSRDFAKKLELGAGDVAALIQHEDIYQLSAFLPPEKEAVFLRRCPGCLAVRWSPDFADILPEMNKAGYYSVECWGGATFDSCIRFLDEDPWDRLRILRKELPHQKLQMLFRGQNMLGYRPYADDAVEYFVQKSVANGIDVIRIFDALNDPRNLQTAIKAANKEGAHVQGCISYTLSPVHNNEYFAAYAKTLEEMGANSICIKDMAGLLTPYTCYDLVKKLKETVSIPVDIHSHYTAGLASMSILKGIEAGADIIDTAMSPLSLGTSHMPTESLVAALQGTDYDTGLDLKQLNVVRAYFAKLREKYIANGQISPKSLGVDANTLLYQVPGGMFSNMLKQLKDAGKEDKLDEVLAEIPRVREDAGYPPLVTPTSQIVGTQAVFNVILGERYKMVTKEFKGLVHGDYGKTPAPIKPEFTKKILGDEQPITCRFADTLAPEMDKLKAEAAKWATQEEDVLTYAMFPQVAPKFFDKRNAKKQGVDGDHVDYANQSHPV